MSHSQSLPRVIEAIALAAEAHRHQRRKDPSRTPYINHPVALMRILAIEAGIDDVDVLCAAVLHDYLEDCCGSEGQPSIEEGRDILSRRLGDKVLSCVDAVTDDKSLDKAERKRLQIEHAGHAPDGAKLVKLADKIANLRDLDEMPPADWDMVRRRQYFDWAKQVVDQIRDVHEGLAKLFDEAYAKRPG